MVFDFILLKNPNKPVNIPLAGGGAFIVYIKHAMHVVYRVQKKHAIFTVYGGIPKIR
jgi:hypothetical protein